MAERIRDSCCDVFEGPADVRRTWEVAGARTSAETEVRRLRL